MPKKEREDMITINQLLLLSIEKNNKERGAGEDDEARARANARETRR